MPQDPLGNSIPPTRYKPLERTSPLGTHEFMLPKAELEAEYPNSNAITWETGPRAGQTAYSPETWDDAGTQAHERIHIGQSRLAAPPNEAELTRFAPGVAPGNRYMPSANLPYQAEEAPAYAIGDPLHPASFGHQFPAGAGDAAAAQNLGLYTNMLKRLRAGDRGIASIESAVPQSVLKQQLMNYPPPVPMPPQVGDLRRGIIPK